jgi:hypothetical protein
VFAAEAASIADEENARSRFPPQGAPPMRLIHLAAIVAMLAVAVSPALAERGGNRHNSDRTPASCSVSGNVVSATGLPTGEVINFMITDSSGTRGWVLGMSDGTWSVDVPAPNGPATYEFVSRTWGPNGSKYDVFASCS